MTGDIFRFCAPGLTPPPLGGELSVRLFGLSA
jgi:hypothetical protein